MLLNLVCMTLVLTISISTAYSQATAEPAEQSKFKKNDILGNIRSPKLLCLLAQSSNPSPPATILWGGPPGRPLRALLTPILYTLI